MNNNKVIEYIESNLIVEEVKDIEFDRFIHRRAQIFIKNLCSEVNGITSLKESETIVRAFYVVRNTKSKKYFDKRPIHNGQKVDDGKIYILYEEITQEFSSNSNLLKADIVIYLGYEPEDKLQMNRRYTSYQSCVDNYDRLY